MSLETLRQHAREIFAAGLAAVDPAQAIRRHVQRTGKTLSIGKVQYDLADYRHVYVIGGGKAGAAMAQGIEELLGEHLTAGMVNVKYGHCLPTSKISLHEAGHPVLDDAGVLGTQRMFDLVRSADRLDLIIGLLSGGGSALLVAPADGVTLPEKQEMTTQLLRCGAPIQAMNALRKHLSRIKGGQLAKLASQATLATLIISDVIGDDLDTIASGPTVPDRSTFRDCINIAQRYTLERTLPVSIWTRLQRGARGEIADTPKAGDRAFIRTQNLIIASNALAVSAALHKAHALGYHSLLLSTFIEGETREAAVFHAAIIKEILHSGQPLTPPACIISGGETTVTVRGSGLGGRNQEFVLAAACELAGVENVVVFSAGTDGTDGPTDAAGAIADGNTYQKAQNLQMDPLTYLQHNDSYHFFESCGDLVKTGPTHTNVMDLRILLIGEQRRNA